MENHYHGYYSGWIEGYYQAVINILKSVFDIRVIPYNPRHITYKCKKAVTIFIEISLSEG